MNFEETNIQFIASSFLYEVLILFFSHSAWRDSFSHSLRIGLLVRNSHSLYFTWKCFYFSFILNDLPDPELVADSYFFQHLKNIVPLPSDLCVFICCLTWCSLIIIHHFSLVAFKVFLCLWFSGVYLQCVFAWVSLDLSYLGFHQLLKSRGFKSNLGRYFSKFRKFHLLFLHIYFSAPHSFSLSSTTTKIQVFIIVL